MANHGAESNGQVKLVLPLANIAGGYCARHVEVGRLTPDQAGALRMLRDGLYRAGSSLADGRPIVSNADVIRWLLEQISGSEQKKQSKPARKPINNSGWGK